MTDEQFPRDLVEFEQAFPNEEACRRYLVDARWREGFQCPRCGATGWRLRARPLFECANGHQTSITAGTVFQGTRKPLRLWFFAMFLMSAQKPGLSAKNLMRLLGFRSYQTAWLWLHKLRRAMVRPGRSKLQGTVEEDECFIDGAITGTKYGRGCGLPLVVGAVEISGKKVGRVRLALVETCGSESLTPFTRTNVAVGSTVATDGWQAYNDLAKHGFRHVRYVDRPRLLPAIHRVFGLLQRWLLGTHHGAVKRKHLQSYLEEFAFRFNRRRSASPGKLFRRLLEHGVARRAVIYVDLVHSRAPFLGEVT